jgi:hypothetical protein
VSVPFVKFTVDERIVDPALDVIMKEVEALSEKYCRHLKRLECWRRIRRLEDEASREVDVGIWIELLLRHFTLTKSRQGCPYGVDSLLE